MEQTNHHDSEYNPFWESDRPPNLSHAGVPSVPDVLFPTVLTRLGLNHATFSGEPSIQELVTALDDPAWARRAAAARILGERREGVSIMPLMAALHDPAWQVRTAAIQALGSLDEHVPIDPLVAALDDED